jgi:hypothetical protein
MSDPIAPVVDQVAAVVDAVSRRAQAAIAKAAAGELLTRIDMQAIFNISRATYFRRYRIHAFDKFLPRPSTTTKPHHYSGVLVAKYLAGEPILSDFTRPTTRRRK